MLLVLEEVVNIEDMPEIDKAVPSAWLLWLCCIKWDSQIIEPVPVVLSKISRDLWSSVPTRHILHHQVCPGLLISGNLLYVNRTTIVFLAAAARNEALL